MIRRTILVFLFSVAIAHAGGADLRRQAPVAEAIDLLERWIGAQCEYRQLPGLAIAVTYDDELLYSRGFGFADLERKIPMTPQTPFHIASITKTFTSTAILQLRDRGKLHLDDRVAQYLPWFQYRNQFPDGPEITIWNLLTHTSGLPSESAFPYWTDNVFPTREEMIRALQNQENIFEPGTQFHYSNLGMAILGEVVAAASGEPYEQYIRKNILEPLDMARTSVFFPAERRAEVAAGYNRRLRDGSRSRSEYVDSKGIAPAANITSTVEDLAKFAAAHMRKGPVGGRQILATSTLREMHRVQWMPAHWKSGWGLGFSVGKNDERITFGHGGWIGSQRSILTASPEEKLAVVVFINADDGSPAFFADRALSMLGAALKKVLPPSPAVAPDSSWGLYVGRYVDPDSTYTDVLLYNGKLMMYGNYPPEENPVGALTELVPAGPHTFRRNEAGGRGEYVIFELGENGRVERIKAAENYLYPAAR